MFSHVEQALDEIGSALDAVEDASTGELRRALSAAKSLRSRVELLETKAASVVASRERHGDGGVGLLSRLGGLSRSEAVRKVRTDAQLAQLPAARRAVSAGEISFANASRLTQAARCAGPAAVQGSADLMQLARTLPDDEFAQAAQRWTARQLTAEAAAERHARLRRSRSVRFWNGDDGSVQMRGAFDPETGARIQHTLRHQAELLRQHDRRQHQHQQQHGQRRTSADHGATAGDAAAGTALRTPDQRMADALDILVTSTRPYHDPGGHTADANTDSSSACATTSITTPVPSQASAPATASPRTANSPTTAASPAPSCGSPVTDRPRHGAPARLPAGMQGRREAQIIVRADLAALLGGPGGVAEIPAGGPVPPAVLQRLACNNDLSLTIFADQLTPVYETTPSRAPTAAQRRALIARDGACIGCNAPPADCEAHHITPWSHGGATRLDNLVLVCWSCHDRIHQHPSIEPRHPPTHNRPKQLLSHWLALLCL